MNIAKIKSSIPKTKFLEKENLKVGNTVSATLKENISHGTSGVPLNDVTKWFTKPVANVTTTVRYKLIFTFPIKQ